MNHNVSYLNGDFNTLSFSDTMGSKKNTTVMFDGQEVNVNSRFWGSLSRMIKDQVSFPSEFKLFSASECLDRLQRQFNQDINFTVENNNGKLTLLGINKQSVDKSFGIDKALGFFENRYQNLDNLTYNNGVLSYIAETNQSIKLFNSDDLQARKILEIPIDGYMQPKVYTEFLRLVCANGMRAESKEFVKNVNFGNEVSRLHDVFDTYENSKTFKSMEDFMNRTCKVQATAGDLKSVMNTIKNTYNVTQDAKVSDEDRVNFNKASQNMRYNILEQSGLKENFGITLISDFDILSTKHLDGLPTQFTGFDLINILTELRTHVNVGDKLKIIDKKVGDLLVKKDWALQDIELPTGVGIDFENHSVGTFFGDRDRNTYKEVYKEEVRQIESKMNKTPLKVVA